MSLFLIKTFLASLFLLIKTGLWQVYNLAISLKVNFKTFSFFLNKLANLLNLKLLEL